MLDYAPEPGGYTKRERHAMRNLLIIIVIIIAAISCAFLIMSSSYQGNSGIPGISGGQGGPPGTSTTGNGNGEPVEPIITTEEQALEEVELNYVHFPGSLAETTVTEYDDYWIVLIKIPGELIYEKTVDKYTGDVVRAVAIQGRYSAPIDTEEKAKELVLYVLGDKTLTEQDIKLESTDELWIYQSSIHYVSINKEDGHYTTGGV